MVKYNVWSVIKMICSWPESIVSLFIHVPNKDTEGGVIEKGKQREFPGGLVVRSLGFHRHGPGSIPGWGTEIPQATQHGQKKKKRRAELPEKCKVILLQGKNAEGQFTNKCISHKTNWYHQNPYIIQRGLNKNKQGLPSRCLCTQSDCSTLYTEVYNFTLFFFYSILQFNTLYYRSLFMWLVPQLIQPENRGCVLFFFIPLAHPYRMLAKGVRSNHCDMYTLLDLKQMTNKDLLYSTGNSAQYPGKRIWKRRDTCIGITESLCCTSETNRTLFINYAPI